MPEKMKFVIVGESFASFKTFIQITKGIINTHCFYIETDGIYTQNIDESRSALYDAWFPRQWFNTYIWNPSFDLEHIIVNANQLCMAIAAVPNDTHGIILELNHKQNNLIVSVLINNANDQNQNHVVKEQFEISRLEIEFEKMNVHDKKCDIEFIMPAKELFDVIKKHRLFGETTVIKCNHQQLEFITVGECKARRFFETSTIEEFNIKNIEKTNVTLAYNTANLEKMLKFHQYIPDAKVKVHLDAEHPLTLIFSNKNKISSTESYVRAYIAPMVCPDDNNNDD